MALARIGLADEEGAALTVDDVAVARGGRLVVGAVSFHLRAGDALQVVGLNGAGKSTLLRAIAGLLRVEQGRIRLTGGAPEASLAEQVHYVGHAEGLKNGLTAGENLRVAAGLLRTGQGACPSDASVALDEVGLAHLSDLPVAYLSAGQRRRVALARLRVAPRPLWALDEPTTALDAEGRDALTRLMTAHLFEGGMIVAATHAPLDLPDARQLRLGP